VHRNRRGTRGRVNLTPEFPGEHEFLRY